VSRRQSKVTPTFHFLRPRHIEPQGDSLLAEQQGNCDTVLPPPTKPSTPRGAVGRRLGGTHATPVHELFHEARGWAAVFTYVMTWGLRMPNARSLASTSLLQAGFRMLHGLCSAHHLLAYKISSKNLAALLMKLITPCLSRLITAHRDH